MITIFVTYPCENTGSGFCQTKFNVKKGNLVTKFPGPKNVVDSPWAKNFINSFLEEYYKAVDSGKLKWEIVDKIFYWPDSDEETIAFMFFFYDDLFMITINQKSESEASISLFKNWEKQNETKVEDQNHFRLCKNVGKAAVNYLKQIEEE